MQIINGMASHQMEWSRERKKNIQKKKTGPFKCLSVPAAAPQHHNAEQSESWPGVIVACKWTVPVFEADATFEVWTEAPSGTASVGPERSDELWRGTTLWPFPRLFFFFCRGNSLKLWIVKSPVNTVNRMHILSRRAIQTNVVGKFSYYHADINLIDNSTCLVGWTDRGTLKNSDFIQMSYAFESLVVRLHYSCPGL